MMLMFHAKVRFLAQSFPTTTAHQSTAHLCRRAFLPLGSGLQASSTCPRSRRVEKALAPSRGKIGAGGGPHGTLAGTLRLMCLGVALRSLVLSEICLVSINTGNYTHWAATSLIYCIILPRARTGNLVPGSTYLRL
ncbi:hypothetical protein FA95DRAFT_487236 [Auriscalpium vulgare]|uniref:Uncharacterized protein n=1 Tax=Auriscalpium vulgare TaxID=40419 RepID=A0ACB8SD14_9AGAM|nr:hypothetical protein FA95DRAFT_487236 [Auriscalpium vulgare]